MNHLKSRLAVAAAIGAVFSTAFAQDSLNIQLVGRSDVLASRNRTVCFSGDHVFIQGFEAVYAVDVSDPERPARLGYWNYGGGQGGSQYELGLAVQGDYVFAAAGSPPSTSVISPTWNTRRPYSRWELVRWAGMLVISHSEMITPSFSPMGEILSFLTPMTQRGHV